MNEAAPEKRRRGGREARRARRATREPRARRPVRGGLEGLVIDNDSIGAALRAVRGIEVSDETLSIAVIRDLCLDRPGHFLGHAQTLKLMHTEYLYPEVGDRGSPKDWLEQGADSVVERAGGVSTRGGES